MLKSNLKVPLLGIMMSKACPLPIYQSIQEDTARLITFTPESISWTKSTVKGLLLQGEKWIRKELPLPHAVYNCRYSDEKWTLKKLEQLIGTGKTFNSVTRFDKWDIHRILAAAPSGRHTPKTQLYSPRGLENLLNQHQAAVIKPRKGHLGQNILLVKINENGEYQLYQYHSIPICTSKSWRGFMQFLRKHLVTEDYVVQQFIPIAMTNSRIFDIRLLVQKGFEEQWNVTATLSRVAVRNYFVTNVCRSIIPVEEALAHKQLDQGKLLEQLTQMSLQIAELLDKHLGLLGEISVDFALDEQNYPWIIEVNGMPSKELFLPLRNRKILKKAYQSPLEYAYSLATK